LVWFGLAEELLIGLFIPVLIISGYMICCKLFQLLTDPIVSLLIIRTMSSLFGYRTFQFWLKFFNQAVGCLNSFCIRMLRLGFCYITYYFVYEILCRKI
jgi:hypothetical protein